MSAGDGLEINKEYLNVVKKKLRQKSEDEKARIQGKISHAAYVGDRFLVLGTAGGFERMNMRTAWKYLWRLGAHNTTESLEFLVRSEDGLRER